MLVPGLNVRWSEQSRHCPIASTKYFIRKPRIKKQRTRASIIRSRMLKATFTYNAGFPGCPNKINVARPLISRPLGIAEIFDRLNAMFAFCKTRRLKKKKKRNEERSSVCLTLCQICSCQIYKVNVGQYIRSVATG